MVWGMALQVSAAGPVGSLFDCEIGISIRPDGIMLSVDTSSTTDADEIGCRNVILHETYNGVTKDIPIQGGSNPGDYYYGSMLYENAKKGASYSASCEHYARWGSTEKTLTGNTGTLVYN